MKDCALRSIATAGMLVAGLTPIPTAAAQEPAGATVQVVDNEYLPARVDIDPGATVEWVWAEDIAEGHTVTSTADPPVFDSGELQAGATFSRQFDTPGTYAYRCLIHPAEMRGTVVVRGEAPATAPDAPTNVSATAGNASATVTWSPPASDGGSPITGYTVTANPGGATAQVGGSARSATVTGLDNGTTYTFTVTAGNAAGTSPPSAASNPVTPSETTDEACPEAPFPDRAEIPPAHQGNVDCAAHLGIVSGFADGTFGPTSQVRRDQMASFIARSLERAGVELPEPTGERFTDVPAGSTHDAAIHRLAAAGIVQGGAGGLPESAYGPGLSVRRDQMASFLLRAAAVASSRQDLASDTQRFSDVGSSNPHFRNVNGAAEEGLVAGLPDGTYRPGAGVRRDQMGTFVMRLFGSVAG